MKKILLIDDHEILLRNMSCFFEDEGFDVLTSLSGEESIDLIKNHKDCSVAIVNMRLSGWTGTETILELHKTHPGLHFIIHTGSSEYILEESLKKLGLKNEDIFFKPLASMQIILDYINTFISLVLFSVPK